MRTQRPRNIVRPVTVLRCAVLLLVVASFGFVDAARVEAQVVTGDPIATAAFAALGRLTGNPQVSAVSGPAPVGPRTTRASAAAPLTIDPATGLPQWTAEVVDYLRSTPDPTPAAATQSTTYAMALDALAVQVAARTGADAAALSAVWQRTGSIRMTVVLTALSQVGTPYRYGGNAPGGFDCSGLTSYSWSAAGVRIPRTSTDQIGAAIPLGLNGLQPGDLVWRPGHIGMAVGVDDVMVNATQTGKPVEVKRWGRVVRTGSPLSS